MTKKECLLCHECKPRSAFVPRKTGCADGLYPYCRPCWNRRANERGKAARRNNSRAAQVARAKAVTWRGANLEKMREACRRWRERNSGYMRGYREAKGALQKAKEAARCAVHAAVQGGTLVKPDHCECCGQEAAGRRLQAHHEDYTMPLQVRWLCTRCHGALHAPGRVGIKQRRRSAA